MAEQNKFLLVDLSVLPEVFTKVVEAKRYMAQGKAKSYSDAAKMAGISRSAFYKYKDKVYPYESNSLAWHRYRYRCASTGNGAMKMWSAMCARSPALCRCALSTHREGEFLP